MRIVWDEPKRLANLKKHGRDFAVLTEEWFAQARIEPARDTRLRAIGPLDDGTIVVICATLGTEGLSVISMRPARPQERRFAQ
jgi:uncharacterized DUF497 family protein